MIARRLSLRGGRFWNVHRTRTVRTARAIPAIAVAGYPEVNSCRQPTNARNQKDPSDQIPSWQQKSNACPSVSAAPAAARLVDRLHPTHGGFPVNLRESFLPRGIVEVQKLNAMKRIERSHSPNAGPAKAAGTVV